ncbi:hypothetical protein GN244_ATG20866 [Phytophthora infestans]|uniref:Uncharacterized protein n=1 Tax=Phytophthora infestans TaxID=4787 RepID=A0A833SS41_PHYIN|nr:hypothetical protein GN244_ATG20866 [Phytophthora infestans]
MIRRRLSPAAEGEVPGDSGAAFVPTPPGSVDPVIQRVTRPDVRAARRRLSTQWGRHRAPSDVLVATIEAIPDTPVDGWIDVSELELAALTPSSTPLGTPNQLSLPASNSILTRQTTRWGPCPTCKDVAPDTPTEGWVVGNGTTQSELTRDPDISSPGMN